MHRLNDERMSKKRFKMELVNELRDLPPSARAQMIAKFSRMEFQIPYSDKTTISRSTLYHWLKLYWMNPDQSDLLMHKVRTDRHIYRNLTQAQKSALEYWREENTYRTLEELREELVEQNLVDARGSVPSETTIGRYLQEKGLDRKTRLALTKDRPEKKIRLAFEAPYPQRLWQADTKGPHFYVADPKNPGKVCLIKPIVIIDDCSRFLVGARYVFEENEAAIMALLRQAFSLYGASDILYVDRGGPYRGKSLARAATLLGCRIIHTAPRDASAKGKSESVMKLFYQKLEQELMTKNTVLTIDEVNEHMAALIRQEYHTDVHSSTGETPEERFFAFPEKYRRFVSKSTLMMVFLPCTIAKVSKTGLIHINKLEYLVPDARLVGKKAEVRCESNDMSRIYVWHDDKYIGEAHLYHKDNDYQKREKILSQLADTKDFEIPDYSDIPPFSRLERRFAAYRAEIESLSMEDGLKDVITKREMVKAQLLEPPAQELKDTSTPTAGAFDVERLQHLLAVLLKRRLSAHERFAIHSTWQKYGPFTEDLVRTEAGRLLGEQCENLSDYLDAMRIAASTIPVK